MSHSVQAFCDWLSASRLSTDIKTAAWLIPAVQTIHILSISVVMGAATMVNLRVLGLSSRRQPLAAVTDRFLPWVWWAVAVLLLSGAVLIVGEPERSLPNIVFLSKMSMLAVVLSLTAILQKPMRHDAWFWERTAARRVGVRVVAGLSLAVWVAIVFAGRWIAYVDVDTV